MKELEALFRSGRQLLGTLSFEPTGDFQDAPRSQFLRRWGGAERRVARATIAVHMPQLRRKQSYRIGIVTQNDNLKVWVDGGRGKIGADTDIEVSASVLQAAGIPLKFAASLDNRQSVEEEAQELLESWGVKLARAASGSVHVPCTSENTGLLLLATALAKRIAKERAAGAEDSGMCTYTLLSTRHQSQHAGPLTLERIFQDVAKARRLRLASAFYDVEVLKELLSGPHASQLLEAQIILNGTGGRRLKEQVKELRAFCRRHNKSRNLVEVRLAMEPGLFHPKLLLLDSGRWRAAYVGSANATRSAFSVNEELLLRLDKGVGPLEHYFDMLWSTLSPMERLLEGRASTSLISFFRTGDIYFKPSNVLQLTFNPFSELLHALPPKEHSKLVKILASYSEPGEGIGPFSLRKALGLKSGPNASESRVSARIKPYAVETSLGYWVPWTLGKKLEARIRRSSQSRARELEFLREAIQAHGRERIVERYQEYLREVRSALDQNDVNYASAVKQFKPGLFEDTAAFQRFLNGITLRLGNEDFKERYARPYVRAAMPEIWDDPIAYRVFKDSFFQYLESVEQRPGKKSRVPGLILKRCRSASRELPLEESLADLLRKQGWKDADWAARAEPGSRKR